MDPLERQLRRVSEQHRRYENERNRLIVEARRGGMALEKIGGLVGLTHAGVRKIVIRMEGGAR